MGRQMGYWREQLGGEVSVLEVATDRPRPAVQSYRGGREYVEVDGERDMTDGQYKYP
jgi:hypothetical protein